MADFKITVRNDGPLRLEGGIALLDRSGLASPCEASELPPPKANA